jgi:hypothetical protein
MVGSEGMVLTLACSGSGNAGSASRTGGNRCGAAGVIDNGINALKWQHCQGLQWRCCDGSVGN